MLDMAMDNRVRSIIDAMGLRIILWNVDTNDWQYTNRPPAEQVSGITQTVRDCIDGLAVNGCTKNPNYGGIILEHDYPYALAIPDVLDVMGSTSFNLRTSSQCAGYDAYGGDWLSRILGEDPTLPPLPPPPPRTTSTSTTTASTTAQSTASTSTTTPSLNLDIKKSFNGNPNTENAASGVSFSGIGTFLIVALTIFLYI
jgi:hypothetical protein